MRTFIRKGLGLTSVIAIGALAAPASASHVSPASLGKYVDAGDELCFREIWGAMRNDCSTARRFAVPVHTYWAGEQRAVVSVTAPDALHPIFCQMITAWDGAPWHIGGGVWTSVYGRAQHLSMTASFAGNGPGWILCTVYPGAQINHVWFSGS